MAAPLFRAVIGHVISFRDGASFGWWLFGVRDYSIKMTTRDNKKTGKIYRRRITQQTELAQRYREHQDVCPGPSRIVMRQLVDRGSSRSMDGVPNELARRSPAQRYVFEDNQDDGSAQTSNDASHGNVVTAVAGLESRYRNVHNCNNHEDVSDWLLLCT
uniref:Uncharacterized protein n=1 Tax=Anopheles atroparvus TaxID=41427 RepID=A0AAG5DSI3_ANOAO